jgi:sugar fermentation stimulation protein A
MKYALTRKPTATTEIESACMPPTLPDGHNGIICWPELIAGTLVRRYKRFLADVRLASGEVVTAHCPNSGSMRACCQPGRPVYISYHDNPKRKLAYTWELIDMPTSLVGVNTQVPNRLVAAAIHAGHVVELQGYESVRREVKAGKHSRIDILLEAAHRRPCYVEVKNCTLVRDGVATFPDAVTTRGQKHLTELQALVTEGCRCAMFFLIQRMDAGSFAPADTIDPVYGRKLRQAAAHGVEILVYDVCIDLQGIRLNASLPCDLSVPSDRS